MFLPTSLPIRVNGAAIRGTRDGPIALRPWAATTQESDAVFVRLPNGVDPIVSLPALPRAVSKANLLDGDAPVLVTSVQHGIVPVLPRRKTDAVDHVMTLVLNR